MVYQKRDKCREKEQVIINTPITITFHCIHEEKLLKEIVWFSDEKYEGKFSIWKLEKLTGIRKKVITSHIKSGKSIKGNYFTWADDSLCQKCFLECPIVTIQDCYTK